MISPNFVCHRSFFTLAAHAGLKANLLFRRHDPLIGPAPHRLPTQKPHFLDQPLLGGVGLPEGSVRVPNRADIDDSRSRSSGWLWKNARSASSLSFVAAMVGFPSSPNLRP